MSTNYTTREERKQFENQLKSTTKNNKGIVRKVLMTLIILSLLCGFVGFGTFFYLVSDAPKLNLAKLDVPVSSKILDKDGNVITELGKEQRIKVSYKEIPKVVEDAFLSTEDVRFYSHNGVDLKRVFGAVLANITGGFGSQGGSTITQQLVKNAFLSPKKTIKRKVQEWYLAFQLEQKYSKHQILEMYLNKVYFSNGLGGQGVYGIEKASETYFGKKIDKITLPEAAILAGMVQSPNYYNPAKHPEQAQQRRNIVLNQMLKYKYITKAEYNQSINIPIKNLIKTKLETPTQYQAFIDEVIKEVQERKNINIYTDGLVVETTLDTKSQKLANEITNRKDFYPDNDFQAGFVLTDTKTGEIRAIGGGRNTTSGGFNYATDIKRQPGSSIKPILDYGPAIQLLKWSTVHQLEDSKYSYSDGTPINDWDRNYMGRISIRNALKLSRNIPALKTLQAVGLNKARDFAVGLGLNLPDQIYESYSIGGFPGEYGVSPLTMAGAYASFGNGGNYIKPYAVKKIKFQDGTEISLIPKSQKAMSDYTSYMITDILRDAVKAGGTGKLANVPGLDMAGKTGTTNYEPDIRAKYGYPSNATHDSWFVGYTPDVTISVWTGYAKNGKGHYISTNTARIAKLIAKEMLSESGNKKSTFVQPNSVIKVGGELYIKGEKTNEFLNHGYVKAVKNLKANYDQNNTSLNLNWEYETKDLENTVFIIDYSFDGVSLPQIITKNTSTIIQGVVPGQIVKISIVAKSAYGKSKPIEVTVDLTNAVSDPSTDPPTDDQPDGNTDDQNNTDDQSNTNNDSSTND